MLIHRRSQKKDAVQLYNHYATTLAAIVLLQMCLHWLFSKQEMNLKLFPPRTIAKSSNRSLVMIKLQRLFDVLAIINISLAPLYKGVKT